MTLAFGDYPYGTEPLSLPPPLSDGSFVELEPGGGGGAGHRPPDRDLAATEDAYGQTRNDQRLFWFRWITGHQLCFVFWHVLGDRLRRAYANRDDGSLLVELVEPCAPLVEGTSAMFVFTATCPRDLYADRIRPFMEISHAAFSGSWAVEYARIPKLVNDVVVAIGDAAPGRALRRAFAESRRVHLAAVHKLVPEGRSVLQQFRARGEGASPPPASGWFIYDSFFLIRREPVGAAALVEQMERRFDALLSDLRAQSLYPEWCSSADETPADLRSGELTRYEGDLEQLVTGAVAAARSCLLDESTAQPALATGSPAPSLRASLPETIRDR